MDVYGKWVNKVLIVDTISDLPLMTRPPDSLPVSNYGGLVASSLLNIFPPLEGFFLELILLLLRITA